MACALSLLPLLFITTGLGVVAALAALGLVLWWQSRSWAIGLRAILVLSAVIVFIGLLYLLQPAVVRSQGEFDGLRNALPKLSEARLLANVFLGYCLAIAAFFGPVAALVAAVWWAARHQLKTAPPSWVMVGAACWLAMLLAGLATWTIGFHYLDAFQFFSNISTPAIVLAIGALLTGGMSRLRPGGQWAVMLLLCGLLSVNLFTLNTRICPMHLTRHYAPAFLQAVRAELPRVAPAGGGFWFADSSYHNSFDMIADSHIAGAYVFNFANYRPITSLSALSVDSIGTDLRFRGNPIDALRKLQNSTIYWFQQLEGRGLPADSLPLRLARRVGLRYVCAGPGVRLPANWQPRILRMYRDPVSNETLYILKPW